MSDTDFGLTLSAADAGRIRGWHEETYQADQARNGAVSVTYLGRSFVVPDSVFAPRPMSEVLGRSILDEVRDSDRVLDMGTGSGVNAVLAASRSHEVVAVDVNSDAVAAARDNAARNGVGERVQAFESDLFERVTGQFDLIVFDPPLRWFAPRDMYERSMADHNYETLGAFIGDVHNYLRVDGRVLVFFATSGDLDHLYRLIETAGLDCQELRRSETTRDGTPVTCFAFKLTHGSGRAAS
jgi:release factor glutamine methyltransferase